MLQKKTGPVHLCSDQVNFSEIHYLPKYGFAQKICSFRKVRSTHFSVKRNLSYKFNQQCQKANICVLLTDFKSRRLEVGIFCSKKYLIFFEKKNHISSKKRVLQDKTKNLQRSIQSLRGNVFIIICDQVTTLCLQLDD